MGTDLKTTNPKLRERILRQIADEDNARNKGRGTHTEQKESSLPRPQRKVADRQANQGKDANAGGRYSVHVVFRMSDKRKRDGFGMLETVADALVGAVGRFLEGNTGQWIYDDNRSKGAGGSGHNH